MTKQSRLTIKGQVTIPKDVRDMLGLQAGDLVKFVEEEGGVTVRKGEEPKSLTFNDRIERARALANPLPLGMSTDEYMALIREPLPPYDE